MVKVFKKKLQAFMGRSLQSTSTTASQRDNPRNKNDDLAATFLKIAHSVNHKKQPENHKLKMVNISMAVTLPLYIYPAGNIWQPLVDSIAANPTTSFGLIVNPNNGPGDETYPDANYISNIAWLNSYNNVVLLGYVYTNWGARNASEVEADISIYEGWSTYTASDIHVDGIFMDEAPSDTSYLPYLAGLTQYTKQVMTNGDYVCFNPGTAVNAAFYRYADAITAFENSYQEWIARGNNSIPVALRSKSIVLIHNYTATDEQLKSDTASLMDAGYYGALITSEQGYESFSSSWAQFAGDITMQEAHYTSSTNDSMLGVSPAVDTLSMNSFVVLPSSSTVLTASSSTNVPIQQASSSATPTLRSTTTSKTSVSSTKAATTSTKPVSSSRSSSSKSSSSASSKKMTNSSTKTSSATSSIIRSASSSIKASNFSSSSAKSTAKTTTPYVNKAKASSVSVVR